MYKKYAYVYDLIYSNKNYKKDSERIRKFIKRYKKTKGRDLIEFACGSGNFLKYLKKDFNWIGVDINEEMLKIAKKKVKGVKFFKGNMVNIKINKKFDVVLCLFSSIGYLRNYKNLKKTIKNFSDHLKDGGVIIIEPWVALENFKTGIPYMLTYDDKKIKIARLDVIKKKGNLSILELNFLIAEKNKDVVHFVDKHELGLFSIKKTLQIMNENGLKAKFIKNKNEKFYRGAFIGVKNKFI